MRTSPSPLWPGLAAPPRATVRGAAAWGMVALVVAVAFLGKFGGTFAVAAWTGMARREAAALGVAMSAKGLVELIVLNIGKERKVCCVCYMEVWQLALNINNHERVHVCLMGICGECRCWMTQRSPSS